MYLRVRRLMDNFDWKFLLAVLALASVVGAVWLSGR